MRCNGCGKCRSYCPIMDEEHEEFSTPRAKINLLTQNLEAQNDFGSIKYDKTFMNHLSRCVDCNLCISKCPAGIDMPKLYNAIKR